MAALGAARVNLDAAHGHLLTSGSKTVFVNSQPLGYVTSATGRGAVVTRGSLTVTSENNKAARVTDALSDGSVISSGSQDVFIGEGGT
jgi:uncharacterized Zn-binding protein involved in type VI secretion